LLGFIVACESARATVGADPAALVSSRATATPEADASTAVLPKNGNEADEGGLRHAYYSNIAKLHECVHLNDDGSLRGESCPSTLVVFGPYISAPANSNVHVRFDIDSTSHLTLMSDVLSNSAKQFHGALEERAVRANERARVQYRIHIFEPVHALEARIGVRAESPVNFSITDYSLTIE
jgi:hypothetical protein